MLELSRRRLSQLLSFRLFLDTWVSNVKPQWCAFSIYFIMFCYKFLIPTFTYVGTDCSDKTNNQQIVWNKTANVRDRSMMRHSVIFGISSKTRIIIRFFFLQMKISAVRKALEKNRRETEYTEHMYIAYRQLVGFKKQQQHLYALVEFHSTSTSNVRFIFILWNVQINIEHFNRWRWMQSKCILLTD